MPYYFSLKNNNIVYNLCFWHVDLAYSFRKLICERTLTVILHMSVYAHTETASMSGRTWTYTFTSIIGLEPIVQCLMGSLQNEHSWALCIWTVWNAIDFVKLSSVINSNLFSAHICMSCVLQKRIFLPIHPVHSIKEYPTHVVTICKLYLYKTQAISLYSQQRSFNVL